MFIVDALKEIILLCAVVAFAAVLSTALLAWRHAPEYVWHLKAK